MTIPCIHYWFSSGRRAGQVRFCWNGRNISGGLKKLQLEVEAAMTHQHDGETTSLFRGQLSTGFRKHSRNSVDVPLEPIQQMQWDYFWPKVRIVSGDDNGAGVVVINGHGQEPIYANGRVAKSSPSNTTIEPGSLFCPECGIAFDPDEAFFGGSPDSYYPRSRLELVTAVFTGNRKKTRERWVAVDGKNTMFDYVFCPNKHPLPLMTGLYDRFVVGILGQDSSVDRYSKEWNRSLARRNSKLFAKTAEDARVGGGRQGTLLTLYPRKNHFPVHFWLYRFWETPSPQSDSWEFAKRLNGLVVLVDPLAPGNSADLLSKFWQRMDPPAGTRLPTSLALVLENCDALVARGRLPRNIAWNLPSVPGSRHNPLVQADTSARLSEYVAEEMPKLYRIAQDQFSSAAFFGTNSVGDQQGGKPIHRGEDALMWMLGNRQQIPVQEPNEALKQIGSCKQPAYVFS